jgi:hypothetical protein
VRVRVTTPATLLAQHRTVNKPKTTKRNGRNTQNTTTEDKNHFQNQNHRHKKQRQQLTKVVNITDT